MQGEELLETLVAATGLPACGADRELLRVIKEADLDPSIITLDRLREILANYLQDVLLNSVLEEPAPQATSRSACD